MATDTLGAVPADPKTIEEVEALATSIQRQASRIESLVEAIDQAIDFNTDDQEILERTEHALNYLALIAEQARLTRRHGELVETFTVKSEKATEQ